MTFPSNTSDRIVSDLVKQDPSFADIVEEFVNGLPNRLSQIETAIRQREFDDLRRFAHQLKGSGGGYGFDILTELGRSLEHAAMGRHLEDCERSLAELRETIRRVVVSV